MMIFAMSNLAVTVFILDENRFICQVARECDSCDAETRKCALEPIPPRKWSCVSPSLATCLLV